MTKKSRLILVSNRLPFSIVERNGKNEFTPSSGGLVSAIKSFLQKTKPNLKDNDEDVPLWIGTSGTGDSIISGTKEQKGIFFDGFELAPLTIPAALNDKFYNGFCNDTIWPLFHYFPSFAKFNDDFFDAYVRTNELFCDRVMEMYQQGDTIWIHDYHLMLLPAMLRERLPDASIGFFLHIPFPSFELFRLLPSTWRKGILEGLLGADLVGFHTNDYAQHFIKSVREILGHESKLREINTPERSITVDTFPISVDYNKFSKAADNREIFSERNKIRKRLYNTRLIISVDRLDYAKGLANRLESFEVFLEKYPEYRGKTTYLLLVVPSRDIIPRYNKTKKEIEGLVSRINGKYGNIDWTPVVYQYTSLNFTELTGLYLAADVALITPMRDGMNLVAKEFVITRADKRGALILSETAGAAAELGEAILVNPTDRLEIAAAIHEALTMPVAEQIRRYDAMQKRLMDYDVMRWADDFLMQLHLRKTKQERLKIKAVTPLIEEQICQHYEKAEKRLLLLDYDGTLAPLASLPQLAVPDEQLLDVLRAICSSPQNEVVLISGRPIAILDKWFGELSLSLVAEHGAFYKKSGKSWLQTVPVNASWKAEVMQLLTLFTERCPGSFVEEKTLSLAWHYRKAEKELGFMRSRELINALSDLSSHLNFQVIEGNKVVEARARGVDKGVAVSRWLRETKWDFVLAMGDDRTDEDMFRVIPEHQYSIRIGLTPSAAKYNLRSQSGVGLLLRKLMNEPQLQEARN